MRQNSLIAMVMTCRKRERGVCWKESEGDETVGSEDQGGDSFNEDTVAMKVERKEVKG